MILSFELPFALIPLLKFCNSSKKVGPLKESIYVSFLKPFLQPKISLLMGRNPIQIQPTPSPLYTVHQTSSVHFITSKIQTNPTRARFRTKPTQSIIVKWSQPISNPWTQPKSCAVQDCRLRHFVSSRGGGGDHGCSAPC